MNETYHGEVFRYEPSKGYGFIKPDEGGPDVFLHISQLVHGQDPDRLKPHERVTYQVTQDSKGSKAMHIRFEDGEPPELDDDLCDVLTVSEFDQVLDGIVTRVRAEMHDIARRHGWVA